MLDEVNENFVFVCGKERERGLVGPNGKNQPIGKLGFV